jgi:hypothetical protein
LAWIPGIVSIAFVPLFIASFAVVERRGDRRDGAVLFTGNVGAVVVFLRVVSVVVAMLMRIFVTPFAVFANASMSFFVPPRLFVALWKYYYRGTRGKSPLPAI